MSVDGISASIERIESRIAQIQSMMGTAPTTATTASTTTATTNSASFEKVLNSITGDAASTYVSDAVSGEDVVAQAKTYVGTPYVFGGSSPSGVDCSGLVQLVLKDLGVENAPRALSDQAKLGTEVGSLAEARPGDLISLDGGAHIVIYAGDGKVVHAPAAGRDVTVANVWFDDSQIDTIRRVVPSESEIAAAQSAAAAIDSTSATSALSSLQSSGLLSQLGGSSDSSGVLSMLSSLTGSSSSASSSSSLTSMLSSLTGSASASGSSSDVLNQITAAQAALTARSAS